MNTSSSSSFNYYNPNPLYKPSKSGKIKRWKLCDCVVRAICKATGMDWVSAYKFASDSAVKVFDTFTGSVGFVQVMQDLGFKKVSYPKGQSRETVREFVRNHPGVTAVLNLAGHCVCVSDGKYHDVWDCGDMTAYNYWIKA